MRATIAWPLATVVGLAACAVVEPLRDELWAPYVGAAATLRVSHLTGLVPFSLAEGLQAVAAAGALWAFSGLVAASLRRDRARWTRWARAIGLAGAALLASFYGLWGLHYADPSLADRLSWCADNPSDLEVLALGEALVDEANRARRVAESSGPPRDDPNAALDVGLVRAFSALRLPLHHIPARGPVKPLLASGWLYARLGISGFYFPFTGEANVVPGQPDWYARVVAAHEKAHQRGIASEDEANFVGFLGAIHSPDPWARYGGWLFAQRQALTAVQRRLPGPVQRAIRRRLPAVQEDVLALRAFWQRYEGPGRAVGEAINDSYLRLHRVPGGTAAYGASLRLISAWSREGGCPGG